MAWTCRRQKNGLTCATENPVRAKRCAGCGRLRPAKRKPTHMRALELPYEHFVALNGGEHCGICGKPPSATRRLDRDHCHKSGKPRGVLCWSCNRQLRAWMTVPWLEAAAAYLARSMREDAA